MSRPRASNARTALAAAAAILVAGCSTAATGTTDTRSAAGRIEVAATINAWGSILSQLGGSRVRAVSLITSPDTDPHDYEPTPADGRVIARARLFVQNGIGYDSWASQAAQADPNPARTVITVGRLTGTPDDGNPHRWYSPGDVEQVADAITADLKRIDPAGAPYFEARRRTFETTGLAAYHALIKDIRTRYAGTPVGASESIFAPLSEALGLRLVTPPNFLKAISQGTDPSAADKAVIDAQISGRKVKAYVFNRQNSTPDVSAQVAEAKAAGVPIVSITETLAPAGASFQDWQAAQLKVLQAALAGSTGR